MKDSVQTRYGTITNFYPPGNPTSSFTVESGKRVFNTRNGEGTGDFSSPTSYGFRMRDVRFREGLLSRQDLPYEPLVQLGPWSAGLGDPFGWTPSTIFPELLEIALGRLMDDIRGGNQVIVDLAEAGSTLRMVTAQNNLGNRVSEILSIIGGEVTRKRKFFERLDKRDRTQKILDFATSRWLEYRYGWMPVALSVYEALDILHKENLSKVRTIKATSKRTVLGERTYSSSEFIGSIPGVHLHSGTERCKLVVEMFTPGAGIWDWTSLNPSVIAWELLPLSFIADWFISVGESLSYLENWLLFKNQFRGGYVTYSAKGEESFYIKGQVSNGTTTIVRDQGGTSHSVFKNRVVLTELPLPYAPRIRVNLNAKRVLDSVTLASSTWRRQIRGYGSKF